MSFEPWAEPPLAAEDQDIDQAGDHRRTEKGRSIRVISRFLPGKLNLAMAQERNDAEDQIERYCHGGGQQGQLDCCQGVRLAEGRQVDRRALFRKPG